MEGIKNLKRVYHRGMNSGFYLKMPTADDFSFSENGEQGEKKEFVGKVEKFWRKAGAASVRLSTGKLKVGDEVYLIGDNIGIKRTSVKSIELEGRGVDVAKKGDEVGVRFVRSKGEERVGSGTEVYVVRKK